MELLNAIYETDFPCVSYGFRLGAPSMMRWMLLANIYLHYVYDLWADQWRKREATGEVIVIRYADDTIVGFRRHADAERFLHDLQERLAKFRCRSLDFHRLHAHLREAERRTVHPGAAYHRQADASQTRRDQGDAQPHAPPARARTGPLAGPSDARLFRVSCRADQRAEDHVLSPPCRVALATRALAPQPEGRRSMAADEPDRRTLVATRPRPAPLAAAALPRQTPKVGAECVRSARSDLSGGRRVTPASLICCKLLG